MYNRKESNKNSYYPAFLCMEVDTPDFLDALACIPLDERTEAAFIHEYIHYLQDLTTITGHARIETIVDQIKWAAGISTNHKKLRIPLDASSTYAFNMKPNYTSLNLCKGDLKVKNVHGRFTPHIEEIILFQLENSRINLPNGINVHSDVRATLLFKDERGFQHKYVVGELAISESMAYLIENMMYNQTLQEGSDCPYKVVQKIIEWKVSRRFDNLTLIALCDVCLMYSLPGKVLYHLLEFLKTYNGKITPALIYIYGLGPNVSKLFNRTGCWILEFKRVFYESKRQFYDYFNHPQWNHIMDAVTVIYDSALELRLNNPTFFLDIASGGRLYTNRAFKKALSMVGCLSIKTSRNLVYNISPINYVEQYVDADWFISLHQLYNILFTSDAIKKDNNGTNHIEKNCELKDWCHNCFIQKGEFDITQNSRNCKYEPWLNVSPDILERCSFGRLWAAYGFDRIKLKPKG